MSRDKQIEEMAKTVKIAHDEQRYLTSDRSINKIAEYLYTAGYRRAGDVAREIFEEIESICDDFPIYGNVNTIILSERDLAFLKKEIHGGQERRWQLK